MKYFHPRKYWRLTKEWLHDCFWYYLLPDKWYYQIEYKLRTGNRLRLNDPHTLVEKMHWLKLYYRKPLMTLLADKYKVKDYIRDNIGDKYVVPTLAIYHSVDEIEWDALPDKFVIKCNHDAASSFFCKEKSVFDTKRVCELLNFFLHRNYSHFENKQWAYKNIQPVIMVEPYLQNSDGSDIVDYKFYCYGGELMYFMYSLGEAQHQVRNVKLSPDKILVDQYFKKDSQLSQNEIKLPVNIDEMIKIAREEGKKFPHVRLDMYNIDGKIYIGEYTFYSNGGFINIYSEEYSQMLADKIDLNRILNNEYL